MGQGFRDLVAWQKAYELALKIYDLTKKFPSDERYGLTSQARRASISISANIAEGYERKHRREYIQFLMIAKGSLGEVETYLLFSRDLGYVNAVEYEQLELKRKELSKVLNGLIRSLTT